MKKIFFSILLFSSLQPAFASADNNIIDSAEITLSTAIDTVPFVLDEEEMMDYNDSLVSFPAYDLYCGWDTVNIHSIKFDVASLKDSTKNIVLFDEKS
jgi:hypothetical protein